MVRVMLQGAQRGVFITRGRDEGKSIEGLYIPEQSNEFDQRTENEEGGGVVRFRSNINNILKVKRKDRLREKGTP